MASGSPRRRMLMQKMGLICTVIPSDFEEYLDDSRSAAELAKELGLGKARAVAKAHPKALVIGSDTIVTLNGHHLGKTADSNEARAILRAHAGQTAVVTTSVALLCIELGIETAETDEAAVAFCPLDEAAIEAYLRTGDWKDKAGSWGIQSGAAPLIDHLEGAYDTVLGLPTATLARLLAGQGIEARPVRLVAPVRIKQ